MKLAKRFCTKGMMTKTIAKTMIGAMSDVSDAEIDAALSGIAA